ncbi:MAG: Trk system potassium transporter TrkA [Clostridiales Family XIII bacterium]|nr:Trk system potassium transporter TrkA [Clostridiales Family XIII bacterium]
MKIAVVGGGKLGIDLIENLLGGEHSVTLIDKNEVLINQIADILDINTVVGNGKVVSLLKEIDIASFDYLVATTDRDEKNIVISSIAKKLGAKKVIARVRDPEHVDQLEFIQDKFDIDYVINPDLSISFEINKYLVEKYTLSNGLFRAGKISMLEFEVNKRPEIIGTTVQIASRILGKVRIFAISVYGKLVIPGPNTIIEQDSTIYIAGEIGFIESISKRVLEKGKYTNIEKVMIAGGGKTGLYLARFLERSGASVKIIEPNKERCQYLATHLQNVLVLHGDATDTKLLEEENYTDMDAFVSTTGFDEENLLLALMAKRSGIEDVIAKISRESYGDLIESMGVDMALNPIDISTGHILRYMQGERIIASQIIQGQAEIIEIIADDTMIFTDRPISRMQLPDGMAIVAIQRFEEVIIPTGKTTIEEGDRVFIILMLSETFDLEKLLKAKKGFFS